LSWNFKFTTERNFVKDGDGLNTDTITVLCSGVALGVYIPAILISRQLKRRGFATEVAVLETYLQKDKISKLAGNKKAFHHNFRIAKTAHKIVKDVTPNLDERLVEQLLDGWLEEERSVFIVFSGFWLPLLQRYERKASHLTLRVDLVHMDAVVSPSWKLFYADCQPRNDIWLFDWQHKKLPYGISVTDDAPIPYERRSDRVVIHGGGWGMGTYRDNIAELRSNGLHLDIVLYELEEAEDEREGDRYFMVDPDWSPWLANEQSEHEFPPVGQVIRKRYIPRSFREDCHPMYDIIAGSKAVVSKPGGGTLLDSLASATPLIMLEPLGEHEQKNAELWEHLGFGILFETWREQDFRLDILYSLHVNLANASHTLIDYGRNYA
jgi:hypothetical protein